MFLRDLDIPNSHPHCKGDVFQIQIGPKLQEICKPTQGFYWQVGPFKKSYVVTFTFTSNHDWQRGRGFKLGFWAKQMFAPVNDVGTCGDFNAFSRY